MKQNNLEISKISFVSLSENKTSFEIHFLRQIKRYKSFSNQISHRITISRTKKNSNLYKFYIF